MFSLRKNLQNNLLSYIFFFLLFFLLAFFQTKGIIFYDEGYMLNTAQRVVDGQIIYRDFDFAYMPGSVWLVAVCFKIWGSSIFTSRLLMIVVAWITSLIIFFLSRYITKKSLFCYIAVLVYVVWGPLHIPFAWPVMFAMPAVLFSAFFFYRGVALKKREYIFLAGICCFCTFLMKQNFVFAPIASFFIAFLFVKELRKKEIVLSFFSGILISTIVFVLYLAVTKSFASFWENLRIYTYERIIVDQSLNTAFISEKNICSFLIKLIVYLLPAILAILSLFICWKKRRILIIFPLTVLFFYLLGIRPTTDYDHLVPLLGFAGILVPFLAKRRFRFQYGIVLVCSIVFIFVGIYTAWEKNFYRWNAPLSQNTSYYIASRGHIYIDGSSSREVTAIVRFIHKYTSSSQPIFVTYYQPMWYFLSSRTNPTRFDLLEPSPVYKQDTKNITKIVDEKKVPVIITPSNWRGSFLSTYIIRHYYLALQTTDQTVWLRNSP